MNKLEIGKKYKTKNDLGSIDIIYEVLNIDNKCMAYKILEDRSEILIYSTIGKCMLKSQFVRNSEEII